MHQMHVALELKYQQLQGLKTVLESKKKRQMKKKVLPLLPQDPNVQDGAIFWDPASKARADRRMRDAEKQAIADEAAKADQKQIKHNTNVIKEKKKKKKKKAALRREEVAQRRAQEAHEKEARKAEKERVKELKNAQKVSRMPKQINRKASKK
jgi:hypothetical protein